MNPEARIRDLMEALDRSKTSPTGRVTVSRTLIYQAKQEIENLLHRVTVLETERALGDAPQAPPAAVPDGYALVPVEPTDDMVRAGAWEFADCAANDVFSRAAAENIWSQMVTQATTATAERKGEP